MKVWRPAGFGGLEIEEADLISNLIIPPHLLTGYELTVALGGSTTIRYRNENFFFEDYRNLFLMQHPGEVISASAGTRNLPVSAHTLRLYPKLMRSVQRDLDLPASPPYFPAITAPNALNAPIAALTKRTVQSFAAPASTLERESRLLELVHAVFTHCSDTPPPDYKLGKEHRAVTLAKEAMRAHLEFDHRLDDLADLTQLNKYYLKEVFTRDVGLSPHRYLTGLRIERAKALLAGGTALAQVAFETGFVDQSHLSHAFKKYVKVTPGRFQRASLA